MKSFRVLTAMVLGLSMVCVLSAASSGEQTATYTAGQEKKHIFLTEVSEDVGVLHSCLAARYRPPVKADLTVTSPDISALVPPAGLIISPVQSLQTAIAASPRREITTGSKNKK